MGNRLTRTCSFEPEEGHGGRRQRHGQAELISLVLIVGMTVLGMSAILVFGTSVLTDSRGDSRVGSAEHAMTQFDSQVSLVALGSSSQQQASLIAGGPNERLYVDGGAGWMNVSIINESTGSAEVVVLNETLGAVIYEREGTTIAYQGGGVWKQTPTGTTMVSPPEFHYRITNGRDPTLTLPLVLIDGEGTLDRTLAVEEASPVVSKFPVSGNGDRSNPLTSGEVNVTVHGEYYHAWGRFFEDRTGGTVSYDHDRHRVMITLEVPESDQQTISRALTSTAGDEEMKLSGSGANPAFVDSYNSTEGEYSDSRAWNGTIELAGDIEVGGNGEIHGDLRSGGHVELKGGALVNGSVFWTTGFSPKGSADYDDDEEINGVASPESSTSRVQNTVDELQSTNDNGNTTAISDDTLDLAEAPLTLSAGEYYLKEDTQLAGEHVTLDTSDGDVTLGIDGNLELTDGSNISVAGDGKASIYVTGDIVVEDDADLYVKNHRSDQLWVYGTGDEDVRIEGSAGQSPTVVGVIYAPRGENEDGDTTIKHGSVYGAIVAGHVSINSGGAVHYDTALLDETAFSEGSSEDTAQITFLHVSLNRVTVSDN